jgi:hypothetical protein
MGKIIFALILLSSSMGFAGGSAQGSRHNRDGMGGVAQSSFDYHVSYVDPLGNYMYFDFNVDASGRAYATNIVIGNNDLRSPQYGVRQLAYMRGTFDKGNLTFSNNPAVGESFNLSGDLNQVTFEGTVYLNGYKVKFPQTTMVRPPSKPVLGTKGSKLNPDGTPKEPTICVEIFQ